MYRLKLEIPFETLEKLKQKSIEKSVSISNLVLIALSNEMEHDFSTLDIEIENSNSEYAYADEGGKILTYLKTKKYPISREHLIIHRKEIGVNNVQTLLNALGELVKLSLIRQVKPSPEKYKNFNLENIKLYRVIKQTEKTSREVKLFRKLREKYDGIN